MQSQGNRSPSETKMWDTPISTRPERASDSEINEKYREGEQRIVTESNREKLPNFVSALTRPNYMQVRPFYQRRQRWDVKRASRLIESFIMNIPVPPLFVYEKDFNQYEVMDGQQRITALQSFYNGEFTLTGLEIWPELNNRTYSTLPSQVRHGLDRRSISYVVVLRESSQNEEDAMFLRHTVFERLNTGGVELGAQEIRNCLFHGAFNDLIEELSKDHRLRKALQLPSYTPEEDEGVAAINGYTIFQKMEDVELVLRFFALRHAEKYTRGMRGFLDIYMARASNFRPDDLAHLRDLFQRTISLALAIYGDKVFRPYDPETRSWSNHWRKALYDAQMVALAEHIDQASTLEKNSSQIIDNTIQLFIDNPEGTFTGRGNTKRDVKERINKFRTMFSANSG